MDYEYTPFSESNVTQILFEPVGTLKNQHWSYQVLLHF